MIAYKPIRTQINNGTLSGVKAMPQKDITSDGTGSFALDRHNYSQSYTNSQLKQKKFIGGNRDASSVIARRRANEVGVGSLNAGAGFTSFTTTRDINVTSNALSRVRGGGYMVPAKARHIPAAMDPRKYIF